MGEFNETEALKGMPIYQETLKDQMNGHGNGHATNWSDLDALPEEENPPVKDFFRCTDLGNGERLIAGHGKNLLYCNQWKKWLCWNSSLWEPDDTQQIRHLARMTVRSIYDAAKEVAEEAKNEIGDERKALLVDRAKALLAHAYKSEATHRMNAMIQEAQKDCPVLPDQLDADPWLLNVANGTLDLRTGTLRPHNRKDHLTKIIPIHYDPQAGCSLWEAFLEDIFAGKNDLIEFIRKAIGYSLTGDTREDCLFLLYGTGANGKTTFQNILRAVCGDYGKQAEFSTFLHRERETVRNDLADLRGARLVTAGEPDKDKRLSESVVKHLTGRDPVKARFLFHEYFEFLPQMKLWLAANHKPTIRGTDHAIWRRVRLIPFTQRFTKEGEEPAKKIDADLTVKLLEELPGILAWAVRGCLAWQQEGLPLPEAVQVATADYRKEMDSIGNFIAECCEQKPHLRVKSTDLYNAYILWSGERQMTQNSFGRELTEGGWERVNKRWIKGLALLDAEEAL